MDTGDKRFQRMTQTPIPKLVLSLAFPTMISMMITSIYNMADTFFCGSDRNQRFCRRRYLLLTHGHRPGHRLHAWHGFGQFYIQAFRLEGCRRRIKGCCNQLFYSAGDRISSHTARQGLFFLPAILILPNLFGLIGIQISQPLADISTFILAIPMGMSVLNELKALQQSKTTLELDKEAVYDGTTTG